MRLPVSARWNPLRATIWGACIGALVAAFELTGHWDMSQAVHQIARVVGGAIGGGVLFGLAAVIRNWVRDV